MPEITIVDRRGSALGRIHNDGTEEISENWGKQAPKEPEQAEPAKHKHAKRRTQKDTQESDRSEP